MTFNHRTPKIEGYQITKAIIDEFGEKLITTNLKCSQPTVSQWVDLNDARRTESIFTRVRNLLMDLEDSGDKGLELATRLCRFFCSVIDCVPVKNTPNKISLIDLVNTLSKNLNESAHVQVAYAAMIGDMVATTDEIEKNLYELNHQIEAAYQSKLILERLHEQAVKNGGQINLDLNKMTEKTLVT